MNLKTAAVIGVVLLAVILAAALFYGHNNQAENTTNTSVERDQSHNGDGWIFWTVGEANTAQKMNQTMQIRQIVWT